MLDSSKMIQTKMRYSGPLGCGLDRGAEVPTSVKILLCPESHTAASDCNGGLLLEKPRFILDCRTKKKKVRWDQFRLG